MDEPDDGMMRARVFSTFLLAVTMLIWGGTYVVTKAGVEDAPPMLYALLRYSVASLFLGAIALLRRGNPKLPRTATRGTLVLMGLTGVALYYTGFNLALSYTTASQGALVQASIPAVTALIAVVWLRERLSGQRMLGIGFAIVGVLLIVTGTAADATARAPLLGNLLMFGTVVMWGVYTVLAKRVADADPIVVTAIVSVIGTLMLVPGAVVEAAVGTTPSLSVQAWLGIVYLGALASGAGYLLYNRALRDLDASQVGAFVNVAPVIGVVSGVLILGETITPLAILGGVLVLAGVWLSFRGDVAQTRSTAATRL